MNFDDDGHDDDDDNNINDYDVEDDDSNDHNIDNGVDDHEVIIMTIKTIAVDELKLILS